MVVHHQLLVVQLLCFLEILEMTILTLILVVQFEWRFELTIVMLVVVVSAAMPANIVRDPVQGWSSIDVVVPVLVP